MGGGRALRLGWVRGRALRLEPAGAKRCGYDILGKLPLGKIHIGKLPLGKNPLGKYLTSKYLWIGC